MKTIAMMLSTAFSCAILGACGGGGGGNGGGGGGGGGSGSITVSGVTMNLGGIPQPFVRVVIAGHDPVISDSSGQFSVGNVGTPYDVALFDPYAPSISVYRGLTRANPRLAMALAPTVTPEFEANVSGSVSAGAGFPQPASHKTAVRAFADRGNSNIGGDLGLADTTTGAYSLDPTWGFGAGASPVQLTAVQFEHDVGGFPVTFTGAATATVAVQDGDAAVQNLPLLPVATSSMSGTVNAPAGYTFIGKTPFIESPGFNLMNFDVQDSTPSMAFSFAVPVIASRPFGLLVGMSGDGGASAVVLRNVAPGATGISVDIAAAPHLLFPFDGATGVGHETTFWSSGVPAAVQIFAFDPTGVDGPAYTIFTDETSVQIPDFSEFGILLPPSTEFTVVIGSIGPLPNVDEMTGPLGPIRSDLVTQTGGGGISVTTAP